MGRYFCGNRAVQVGDSTCYQGLFYEAVFPVVARGDGPLQTVSDRMITYNLQCIWLKSSANNGSWRVLQTPDMQ